MIGFDFSARVYQPTSRHPRPTAPPQHVLITTPSRRLAKQTRTRSQIFAPTIAVVKHISYPQATSRALQLAYQSTRGSNHPHSRRSRPRHLSEISRSQRTLANPAPTPSCAGLWLRAAGISRFKWQPGRQYHCEVRGEPSPNTTAYPVTQEGFQTLGLH
jgi:hypothetical protein